MIQKDTREQAFWAGIFPDLVDLDNIPTQAQDIKLESADLTDEGIGFLVSRINTITKLDIRKTAVTKTGIQQLTRLDYLKQLCLLRCAGVQDDCLPYLRAIPGLERLHIGGTSVTLDGLIALGEWPTLKMLILTSALARKQIQEKAPSLMRLLPNCDIIINLEIIDWYLEAKSDSSV